MSLQTQSADPRAADALREKRQEMLNLRRSSMGSFRLKPGESLLDLGMVSSGTLVHQEGTPKTADKLWTLMSSYLSTEPDDIQQYIVNHLEYTLARSRFNSDFFSAYQATAFSTRDRLIEFWNDTNQVFHEKDPKRVYYLSIEFLMGRTLQNALINLDLVNPYTHALSNIGYKLEELMEQEYDAALGNGGLGRLAACFLDSLATLDYPGWGYGIRYNYGMFKQEIHDGHQIELPDYWLIGGNPWEIERNDIAYKIRFGGSVHTLLDARGNLKFVWDGGEEVVAAAYDMPIPGYKTANTLNLRLWSSRPSATFNFDSFNRGDYYSALAQKQQAESISAVLYPNDSSEAGKELRLKQQYFFCAATLTDIIRRFKKRQRSLTQLPEKVAIQLNDTHPTVSIAEMMRKLVDEEGLGWDDAWNVTTRVFAYTNHTVLPEALEKWPVPIFQRMLPRHMQIIYEINARFLAEVERRSPGDGALRSRLSLIEDSGGVPKIRMAHLAVVGSHSVNGVAAIHTEIVKSSVFRDFYTLYPEKFNNKTNGVTPRRWIAAANPEMTKLITATLGNDMWLTHLDECVRLKSNADDVNFQQRFLAVKKRNKERIAQHISKLTAGRLQLDTNALFDVQVKRIHEYKRQLLNILGVIARYKAIQRMSVEERRRAVPRVCIFGGKAAPGYQRAKQIIKLINSVAEVVNNDPSIDNLLKVFFIPNYNVSLAEMIIPASDLSEHISTAGTEASGTSNMKFAMNGGLIIGTLDGANIEIMQEIGEQNIFIFGATAGEIDKIRAIGPRSIDERLYEVLMTIQNGTFGGFYHFESLITPLWNGCDYYLIAHDFRSYLEAQDRVDQTYRNLPKWAKMSVLSTACMGKFSSDRTIHEYAKEIWGLQPCKTPMPEHPVVNVFPRSPLPPKKTDGAHHNS